MNNLEKWKTRQKLESNNLSVVQIKVLKIKLKLNKNSKFYMLVKIKTDYL